MAFADVYVFNGTEYPVEIIRKNNKNTYIRVKDNKVIVTTNYLVSNRKIEELINNNKEFINKNLTKNIKKREDNSFKLFGNTYDIVYGFNDTEIENNKIYTKDEKTFNKYLSKYINEVYEERLNYWYNLFEEKIPVPNLKIRKMTSRWGVCNLKNKNVTLNLELSKYDTNALDYVIVHELSHFIYPNHSKDFWTLVGKYYPKYKEVRKYLRTSV
ncbi:MAG: M48 family metallopeptidase [Bacilli bacterium]